MPTLDLAGWKVSYLDEGRGLPIICLPGITEHKESFPYQLRGLSDRYRVISYDMRPANAGKDGRLKDHAEDLGRIMDALRLPSAVLLGHSFGGLVAQQFAMEHRERITAMVLISSFAKAPEHWGSALVHYMSSGHIHDPDTALGRLQMALGLKKPVPPDPESHLDWVSLQAAKTTPDTVQGRLRAMLSFDSRQALKGLWIPVLILTGQHEKAAFLSAAQFMEHTIPDSVLEVVEDTGHFPHIERFDLTNLYIDEFLGRQLTSLVD